MQILRNAFKAYDIRGKVPEEVNEEMAYRVGRAYAAIFGAKTVAVGHDIRLSGPALRTALVKGLTDTGCTVVDIGMCGTEQIYFATAHLSLDGGIMITASHNPQEYNGMKLVRAGSRPISADSGLKELEDAVVAGAFPPIAAAPGKIVYQDIMAEYIQHLLTYVEVEKLKPLKVVVNAGNGAAGLVIDILEKFLPFHFIKVNCDPDGNFPNGVPNPLLVENREATAAAVRVNRADIGIAWDGDFDRCFLFDEHGEFIEGYYLVGFLAQSFLNKQAGAKIVYDPRLIWNTVEVVKKAGGIPVLHKSGHAFMKERMRQEDAVYGGETSAHHYFRDFFYCDSGMIPWLLVLQIMSLEEKAISQLMKERVACFPISGEINSQVDNPHTVMKKIERLYGPQALNIDYTDGISMEYVDWRFNVRMSNTEPLVRLNVESRCNLGLLKQKTEELLALINS